MLKKSFTASSCIIVLSFVLSACVSGDDNLGLSSFETNVSQPSENIIASEASNASSAYAYATDDNLIFEEVRQRTQKTYLINGLASSIDSIGYGFTNLSKKIEGSTLHNYTSFIESSTIIRRKVTEDIRAEYAKNPDVEINMIGMSFGANIVTLIAADLDRDDIPVNYLVTMDGPAMVPVRDNVRKVDNFRCTNLNCFKTKSKLAKGNTKTEYTNYNIPTSHIPLGDHADVHRQILLQIEADPDIKLAQQ